MAHVAGLTMGVCDWLQDKKLAQAMQGLFASPTMRVNTTTDVVGVEICGALKNVLAIAAGIVEGLDLGHNAMAALIAQVRGFHPRSASLALHPATHVHQTKLGLLLASGRESGHPGSFTAGSQAVCQQPSSAWHLKL